MSLPQINRILYTTSLGPYTRSVYRHAIQLAQQNQAELVMLHVVNPVGELGEALIRQYLPKDLVKKVHDEGVAKVIGQMEERVKLFFDEELNSLDQPVQVNVVPKVVEGNHDEAILATAKQEQVDLIVMGTENKLGLHSQSYTTQQVIKRAKVPVLVVPTGKDFNQ
ncbi:universal stress protein [Amphritea balenae]|uniref:Universal stress protein n=1 Tax=Amphritea balenae TaxID=452629 RepID=A0A3P1SW55_9GAMM|nr:universal stress protein [Amphritea balenae]RRD01434.1 universal stress protein [Amphritea balenae]GGK57166.1 universal stress protein [Amphritea balenae]